MFGHRIFNPSKQKSGYSAKKAKRRKGNLRQRKFSPRVETLEDRTVPTAPLNFVTYQPFAPGAVIERIYTQGEPLPDSENQLINPGPLFLNGNGLEFNFIPEPGTPQQIIDGFIEAANLWSALLFDDIVVNIEIAFQPLPTGILGGASSEGVSVTYSQFRTALENDSLSEDDDLAVTSLPQGNSFDMLINRTSNNPNGSGSATPYLDNNGNANNTTIRINRANAKAVGLIAPGHTAIDASIVFSTLFTWDFDRSDGISAGAFDFVAVAAHEIGHALGFVSGVDILDINSPPQNGPFAENQFVFVSPLDLFRFSTQSVAQGPGVIDWTADVRAKYFSIDGGATPLAEFSTGFFFGDGNQASHWKDDMNIGLMDPTLDPGELGQISARDVQAMDVIGWDITPSNLPPTITVDNATVNAIENVQVTNTGSYDDPDPGDNVLITASIGTVTKTGTNSGTWEWSYTPPDGPAGPIIVTITANDQKGGIANTTFTLNVENGPPVLTLNNEDVVVDEGQTATNSGSFQDGPSDVVTITASIGTVTQVGISSGTWSWSMFAADGPDGPFDVTITATDNDGAEASITFTVTINNVPPIISLTGNSPVDQFDLFTLVLGEVIDPGQDTVTSYTVRWGDGNSQTFSGTPTAGETITHIYLLDGTYTIEIDLVDEDGLHPVAGTFEVTVNRVDPLSATLTASVHVDNDGDGRADPGDTIRYTAVISNTIATPIPGVSFESMLDPHLTLEAGSIQVSPIAFDDAYSVAVNTTFVGTMFNGLLSNDVDPDHLLAVPGVDLRVEIPPGGLTRVGGSVTGSLTVFPDGSFIYDAGSQTGFERFQYFLRDADGLISASPGFVEFTISNFSPLIFAPPPEVSQLSEVELWQMVQTARNRLAALGYSVQQLQPLSQLTFHLADWTGNSVAVAGNGRVYIDRNGGGHGWFIDPTPWTEEEFVHQGGRTYVASSSPAAGRLDLLTVILRQMLEHLHPAAVPAGTLNRILPGIRELPAPPSFDFGQLSALRLQHGFRFAGSYHENWGGLREKWFLDRSGVWYFITPSGNVHRWEGGSLHFSPTVAFLSSAVHSDPNLLFNAPAQMSSIAQATLSWLRQQHGFQFAGSYHENWGGLREKWFLDRSGVWHFITPAGSIHRWISGSAANAPVIVSVDRLAFDDPTSLFREPVHLSASQLEQLGRLRQDYGFRSSGNYYLNYLKQNEKWFLDRQGVWYVVTPAGTLSRWNGGTSLTPIATVSPLIWQDPDLLFRAGSVLTTSTAPGQSGPGGSQGQVTQSQLNIIVTAAIQRWSQAGLTPAQRSLLENTVFEVTNLPDWYLGKSVPGKVQIDDNAAGHGWFVDPTPLFDEEFDLALSSTWLTSSSLNNRLDLLTVVMHEMGHVLGLHDVYDPMYQGSLMYGYLNPNHRRLPSSELLADLGDPAHQVTGSTLLSPVMIGTLPGNKQVRIIFDATVNNPLPANVRQVSVQGVVRGNDPGTGTPLPIRVTDDPTTEIQFDPTVTLIDAAPDLVVNLTSPASSILPAKSLVLSLAFINSGNQEATGAMLRVTLPSFVNVDVNGSSSGWTNHGNGTYLMPLGSMTVGTGSNVNLVISVPFGTGFGTLIPITASIFDDGTQGPDLAVWNNSQSLTIFVEGLDERRWV